MGVDVVRTAGTAPVSVIGLRAAARPWSERKRHVGSSRDRADVRADLEAVFRTEYARVVGVAARVGLWPG